MSKVGHALGVGLVGGILVGSWWTASALSGPAAVAPPTTTQVQVVQVSHPLSTSATPTRRKKVALTGSPIIPEQAPAKAKAQVDSAGADADTDDPGEVTSYNGIPIPVGSTGSSNGSSQVIDPVAPTP